MGYKLIDRDVRASCARKINDNQHSCSSFVRAVADDLMLLLPGAGANADGQLDFMTFISRAPGVFYSLGKGRVAEPRAVTAALGGAFVVCGMTSAELQTNRAQKVSHGHVAIVIGGWGATGWPLAWWGQLGGTPGKGESLSKCFRQTDRPFISYFAYAAE